MTSTIARTAPVGIDVSKRVAAGALGGLVGGVVFGLMMQMMDMIPMVAMLVGSEAVAVGWLVHLAISVVLGIGFGLVSVKGLDAWGPGIGMGLAYGVVWWVLGALIAMPLRLGMPAFTLLHLNEMSDEVARVVAGAGSPVVLQRTAEGVSVLLGADSLETLGGSVDVFERALRAAAGERLSPVSSL